VFLDYTEKVSLKMELNAADLSTLFLCYSSIPCKDTEHI